MEFIGITGGVGSGKSKILNFIKEEYPAYVLLADELAHTLMMPGTPCYKEIRSAFAGEDIYTPQQELDAKKLARVIFSDEVKREKMNGIVHPAVKHEILRLVENKRKSKEFSYFILEAALLIEEGYDNICDELWFIETSDENRRRRLKESRGYSDEKIDAIFDSQLSKEEYRKRCKIVIENNGSLEKTYCRIREIFAKKEQEKTAY